MKTDKEIEEQIELHRKTLKENRDKADKFYRNGRLVPDYLENQYDRLCSRISELEWVLS